MGLTERHWIENEEYRLEDAVENDERMYKLGYSARDSEIVHCIACRHYDFDQGICLKGYKQGYAETWFCADGEKTEPDAPKVMKFHEHLIYYCPRCGELLTQLGTPVECKRCGQRVKWN